MPWQEGCVIMPVNYIETTRRAFADQPPYQWSSFDYSPWTPFKKPLEKSRIALLSTGGLYIKDEQEPFNPVRDDLTFRLIPKDIDVQRLAISHNNYDHTDAEKDPNVVFPLERLRELEREGFIGELAPEAITIMGRIFRRTQLQKEMIPQMLDKLQAMRVDALFLVPA